MSKSAKNKVKIAIVGAGPGGIYTAMRLLESIDDNNNKIYQPEDILVFDAESDLGGRVRTLPLGDTPYTADIGAMRFIKGRQLIISNLIDNKFKLPNHPLSAPIFAYYLRDRIILPHIEEAGKIQMADYENISFDNSVNSTGQKVRDQNAYRLDDWENYFSPSDLLIVAIFTFLSNLQLDANSPKELETVRTTVLDKRDNLKVFWNRERFSGENYAKRVKSFLNNAKIPKGFEYFSLEEWNYIRTFGRNSDKTLYETCLFNILVKELSTEAMTLVVDSFGYNNIFGAANAADHIPWFMNEFASQGYHTIDKGMSRLVDEIDEAISKEVNHKNWFKPNHKLISVKKVNNGYELEFVHNSSVVKISAEKVILGISKGALERIHFDTSFKLNDDLSTCTGAKNLTDAIKCVIAYPLIKAFLFYEEAWFWNKIPFNLQSKLIQECQSGKFPARLNLDSKNQLSTSRVITDLPIKQIYYHGVNGPWKHRNGDNPTCNGMIMAYGDSAQSQLWASLAGRHLPSHIKSNNIDPAFKKLTGLPEDKYQKLTKEFGATRTLGEILHRNLINIFQKGFNINLDDPSDPIKAPIAVFIKDWNDSPFFGGWHAWCINYKPWEVRKHIQRPYNGEDIFIIGETFSSDQGWIEGALRTSELNLRNNFDIKSKPDWLHLNLLDNTSWAANGSANLQDFENYLKW